eukprot:gene6768-biopygen1974
MHYTPDAAAAPIMDAFFKERDKHFATQHHIDSSDDLLGTRLRAIVRSMNPITMVREDPNTKTKHTVKVYVGGDEKLRPDHDVHIGDPTPTLPSQARIANQTYGADIFADVHVVYPDDNDETRDFERVHIGFIPIMIHSKACSLRGLKPHQLRARGECPYDMGGYFVIDGREKVIVTQEERVPNRLYTRRGEKIEDDKLILKAFIRCVSTDARDVFPRTSVFRVMTSGEITATVTHINEGAVPVTTLFRALGIESDRAILKTIFHKDPGEERNKVEIAFMHASIAAGHKSGVSSQIGAIDFLLPRTRFKSQLDLKSVLTDDLFPNVDGREKVIVTQEERVPNRLYTRRGEKIEDDKLILKAFIRCVSTDARDVFPRTSVFRVMTSGEITATVTHINEGAVPVTTLFRALGIESDRAILKTIFHEDPGEERNKVEIAFMHASIAAGHKSGVSSQIGAIDFLLPRTRFKSQLDLKSVLTDDLFPNVGRTFEAKAIALGAVVRHLVRAALGKEPMSELDHYANKRLMCSDRLFGGRFAHGENVVVAISTYTGYNQDDAIIINLDAVQRGRLALTVFDTIRYEESEEEPEDPNTQKTKNQIVFANPERLVSRGYAISTTKTTTTKGYKHLDDQGMPKINNMIREGDAVVGMVKVPSTAAKEDVFTDASQRLDSRESDLPTYVDGVHLQNIDQNTAKDNALPQLRACKVRLRQMRSPELGDKLSLRYGQKGVVGMILPAVDMPFCAEDGIVPDIIINPNAFPNRRTVSHLLEAVLAGAGAVKGARMNADTFGGEDIGAALTQLGLRENGHANMLMHNGRSGEEAKTRFFVGVNYYGRLKHMVEDKYQSRARGAVDATTRQPTKSKGQSGGLRIGEMEQNALVAHGLASFTREAFMQRSDHHSTKVNATSGTPAEWWAAAREDPEGPDEEATVETPYTFTLMQHELRALGVEAALLTTPQK